VALPSGVDQQIVMQRMLDRGVSTRRGVMCAHREGPYTATGESPSVRLPHSEAAQDTGVMLPLQSTLTDAEVASIARLLSDALP
jgi:dTDP-4-amino-4,6-dideoxygalactose transaminase